jgi:hypothetical protein
VSDEGWTLIGPTLALLPEDAGQRRDALHEAFTALRCVVWIGAPWRAAP